MIRIDEIYNNTFWRWLYKNRPELRIFYCDPFGRSDPDSVIGHAREEEGLDTNYVFFFDQEPVHLEIHRATFDKIRHYNNHDIHDPTWHQWLRNTTQPDQIGHIVTSEKNSATVEQLCKEYGWQPHYYFFHGWAALDWYRGYDKSYLIIPPDERTITRTFIAPNRIVGGLRQHRLLMLYHIFKNKLLNNWISCPAVCPAENAAVTDIVKSLTNIYPDIESVFAQQMLPMDFPGETGHPMHSCWLSLFDESAESLLYLVTETVATGQRLHLTEKIFKPICLQMPFVVVGTQGSLSYLRSYGFRTFEGIWDESYDTEPDDVLRIEQIASLLRSLDELPAAGKQELFDQCQEVINHNYQHFYSGAFEQILWQELQEMLHEF